MKCRQAVVRFHEHPGHSLLTIVTAIHNGILNSINITTLAGLGPEAAADVSN